MKYNSLPKHSTFLVSTIIFILVILSFAHISMSQSVLFTNTYNNYFIVLKDLDLRTHYLVTSINYESNIILQINASKNYWINIFYPFIRITPIVMSRGNYRLRGVFIPILLKNKSLCLISYIDNNFEKYIVKNITIPESALISPLFIDHKIAVLNIYAYREALSNGYAFYVVGLDLAAKPSKLLFNISLPITSNHKYLFPSPYSFYINKTILMNILEYYEGMVRLLRISYNLNNNSVNTIHNALFRVNSFSNIKYTRLLNYNTALFIIGNNTVLAKIYPEYRVLINTSIPLPSTSVFIAENALLINNSGSYYSLTLSPQKYIMWFHDENMIVKPMNPNIFGSVLNYKNISLYSPIYPSNLVNYTYVNVVFNNVTLNYTLRSIMHPYPVSYVYLYNNILIYTYSVYDVHNHRIGSGIGYTDLLTGKSETLKYWKNTTVLYLNITYINSSTIRIDYVAYTAKNDDLIRVGNIVLNVAMISGQINPLDEPVYLSTVLLLTLLLILHSYNKARRKRK